MISVVTITYNRAHLIATAIKSVLEQTYTDLEYIIIDDGSADNTETIVKAFNDIRISYHKQDHMGALSKLRNIGIKHGKGEIIAFIDSDDSWSTNYLQELITIYNDQKNNFVISDADLFINNEVIKQSQFKFKPHLNNSAEILKQKLSYNAINIYSSCFSYRRSKINFLMDENFRVGDNDFFLRIIAGFEGCLLLQPLVLIHKHNANMSVEMDFNSSFIQAYYEDLKTLKSLFKENKIKPGLFLKASSQNYYQLANNLAFLGLKRQAAVAYLRSYMLNLLKFKALIRFFINLLPIKIK